MENNKIYLLSTRPLPKSVIEEGAKKDVIIEELSFISVHPIQDDTLKERIKKLSTEEHAVVFTSMNAVESVAAHVDAVPRWKIYSIGNTTNKLIEEKWGKDKVVAKAEYGSMLAERLIDDNVKEVVFFCGNIRRDELPARMRSEHRKVEEVIVYETEELPGKLIKEYDGILFFSPSAVNAFFTHNKTGKATTLFAIGKTTAEAIREHKGRNIVVSKVVGKAEMAFEAIDYLQKVGKK